HALQLTGARRLQVFSHGIIPIVLPSLLGISLYRLDENIRSSLVLGFVGAGGIGFQLLTAMNLSQYQEVSLLLIIIFIVVLTAERISAALRERVAVETLRDFEFELCLDSCDQVEVVSIKSRNRDGRVWMGKNLVIFSDGTGQAGGFRFDEVRGNVYKMYRATRCGPDSLVDPHEQLAFYDPGLGSQADGGHFMGRLLRWVHNIVAQATGFGITRNIIDCYAALVRLWEPGDRIFLFGFSRGAYTVRCLGGVIAKCGIPRQPAKQPEELLKLDEASTQALAAHAVKHIYQFTYPRKMKDATSHQRVLLEVREELARRFRQDHGSFDPGDSAKANVYPYFIGVFDTVAALGNPVTSTLFTLAFLIFAAGLGMLGWLLTHFDQTPVFGPLFAYLTFRNVFWGIIAAGTLISAAVYVFTHFKWAYELFDEDWKKAF